MAHVRYIVHDVEAAVAFEDLSGNVVELFEPA